MIARLAVETPGGTPAPFSKHGAWLTQQSPTARTPRSSPDGVRAAGDPSDSPGRVFESGAGPAPAVAVVLDRPYPLATAAAAAVARAGVAVLPLHDGETPFDLAALAALAEWVGGGAGPAVVFCADPGLVCCVANKSAGVRAVAVTTVAQAARATLTVGANLLAVEMPGRTYWECRQVLEALARPAGVPARLGRLLRELEHADR